MPLTPDAALDLLFPEELVPQHIKDQLPSDLHVRLPIPSSPLLFSPITHWLCRYAPYPRRIMTVDIFPC